MRPSTSLFALLLPVSAALLHLGCADATPPPASRAAHPTLRVQRADVTVAFLSAGGGTVEGNLSQTVLEGGDCTPVTAVAGTGYQFKSWTGQDMAESTDNPLTLTKVSKGLTVQANFTPTLPTPTDSAHAKHMALPNVACTACHVKSLPTVDFPAYYNAKTGPATFDAAAGTCANVSCHGGQVTPAWKTGKLDTNTQCKACHTSGDSQYNGFVGIHAPEHNMFLDNCATCHDTQKLAAVHFSNLQTPTMEGKAGLTIGGDNKSYDLATTSCVTSCHNDQPLPWKKK